MFAVIPMVNRPVPFIFDDYIDMEFGTGALKVTPAHDINDYNLGVKYGLEVIDTINDDGTMSAAARFYVGEDRFVVRKKIAKDLEASGHLVKAEDYRNKVGYSERTDAVIEPKLSMQWFLRMEQVSKPALDNVLNGNIQLIPEKFINTYRHWMENVRDWCISRQLWWGNAFRPGTLLMEPISSSVRRKPKRSGCLKRRGRNSGRGNSGRMKMSLTPGSPVGCGRSVYSTASKIRTTKTFNTITPPTTW